MFDLHGDLRPATQAAITPLATLGEEQADLSLYMGGPNGVWDFGESEAREEDANAARTADGTEQDEEDDDRTTGQNMRPRIPSQPL